jgi:hypothetical protein
MKEIIYIQAGTCANYAGTHFWNTQESYLGEDDAENSVAHDWDVSFREGLSATVRPISIIISGYTLTKSGKPRVNLHFVRDC